MYSVTVPIPGRVRQLAHELHPDLLGFETIREEHSCLLKRLGDVDHVSQLQHRTTRALEGTSAVDAEITGIDYFEDPPLGAAPVVYLAVESPGLEALHADLTETFAPIEGLEGEDYVPHVTLARGGDVTTAKRLADREIEPMSWTVDALEFWNGATKLPVSRVSLSA
ncbi:2'-5' RNA ligase family protein [Natronolimnobius baerhuensis]|uniref:Phosphoesterase n=1 Tax=Natronolimnobius baerhuensis TaxID=253108 RepID=A0A202E5U8_9EURY|nr:2'-5' RNA ligase family protein [Natronolimnobius baerhuensis]OVE83548.1 phosphoesterase [Natronolimnobius baerhuensis]